MLRILGYWTIVFVSLGSCKRHRYLGLWLVLRLGLYLFDLLGYRYHLWHYYFNNIVKVIAAISHSRLIICAFPMTINYELELMYSRSNLIGSLEQKLPLTILNLLERNLLPVCESSCKANLISTLGPFEQMFARRLVHLLCLLSRFIWRWGYLLSYLILNLRIGLLLLLTKFRILNIEPWSTLTRRSFSWSWKVTIPVFGLLIGNLAILASILLLCLVEENISDLGTCVWVVTATWTVFALSRSCWLGWRAESDVHRKTFVGSGLRQSYMLIELSIRLL